MASAAHKETVRYLALDALLGFVNPANPKDHDLGVLISSIERFGFIGSVTMDGDTNSIVAGHGRLKALEAMRRRGDNPPSGIRVGEHGWTVPTDIEHFADETERDAYLIADNQATIRGGWHQDQLAELLATLADSERDDPWQGVGFDGDDLDALMAEHEPLPPMDGDDGDETPGDAPTRYGVVVRLKDREAEDRLVSLLEASNYQCVRMSGDGGDTE